MCEKMTSEYKSDIDSLQPINSKVYTNCGSTTISKNRATMLTSDMRSKPATF